LRFLVLSCLLAISECTEIASIIYSVKSVMQLKPFSHWYVCT
jgi:hypothetical protein